MAVPSVNLTLDKGVDFEATFNVKNSDGTYFSLTGYTASARIRKHPSSTTYKSFSTSITIATGEIKISMGSTTTSTLSPGRNYYDVVITENNTSKKRKVFEGMMIVNETVSV